MKFVLQKSSANEPFTFAFLNAEGKTLARSENYKNRRNAMNGIQSVKKNCQTDGRYDLKESSNGKLYFNLKATNGQVVCTSVMFDSNEDREIAINQLKSVGPEAEVTDTTLQ